MASGDPPSALARLAEKAARAFEAGDYAEARRCVGDLELEARVGGNSLHSRDAARLAQNVAVLDLLDTEREGRLDAAGFRDTLRRALSAFEASSASDAEPADPEADARESRVLRTNFAWALTRCGDDASPYSRPTRLEVVSVLEGVFDETVATDDGCCSTDTLRETIHVASMLTRALAVSGSREDAEKALRILSVAEAMAKPFGDADDDALAWTLRERARASMALGDLVTAKEALVRAGQTSCQKKKSRDELGSLRARLAYLEGDGAAALRAFGERKADTKRTASRDDARTLNLASVFELSGASATASLLLDSMCSRQPRDADADAVTEARTDESDANDAVSRAKKQKKQKTAAYRAGVTLLRAKKPAAAALRVLAGGDAVGAPETFVRLAECACAHAVRGGEVSEDEREAAAAFVAASDGVPLTFSGAQTYLDSAISAIAEMRCDDEDKASSRFRQPRLRAHAHAQRAYVCLALGKRLDALASANETLALVDAAAKNAKGRRRKEDAKGSAVEEDGFEGGELEAYARLAKTYAAEALTSLGRHEEAAKVTQSKAS